ncbi:MAG: putative porin [Prevotella sp.]|nr:putative porin [Prevotella sp.]
MERLIALLASLLLCMAGMAQDINGLEDGNIRDIGSPGMNGRRDSLGNNGKEIPKGLKVWTVDERFGDRIAAEIDTMSHMFMNTPFTTGMRGEYNTTGNLGAPRINRIFIDRMQPAQFMFTQPYDYFITPVEKFHFTNTFSPITNLSFNECGDKNNGEDHLKALFAVNAGKRLGVGMKFDYIYGRGYYQNQSTAHFNYTLYGSYLGDRYQAHLLMSTNHQKVAENGGITDDEYVSHPEIFQDDYRTDEIPTVLQQNWNRNDNQHVFFSHRYNIGFSRKVPMNEEEIQAKKFAMEAQKDKEMRDRRKKMAEEGIEMNEDEEQKTFAGRPEGAKIVGAEPAGEGAEKTDSTRIAVNSKEMADSLISAMAKTNEDTAWLKNEFVPVTSIIHTVKFDNYRRIYQAYQTPKNYYLNTYPLIDGISGDSIYDKTKHYELKNTVALSLLEGFNKWAKAGIKAFITSDLRHFTLPDSLETRFQSYNEHSLSIGGQLSKTEGSLLHYIIGAETWLTGEDAKQLKIDGTADLNFKFLGDTVQLAAKAFIHSTHPEFFKRHYHGKHLWWDKDYDMEYHTRIEGSFTYKKTRTNLRVAVDDMKNYTYFTQSYTNDDNARSATTVEARQCSDNISLLTLQLNQDVTLGPLNWESQITYQETSKAEVLPVPKLNIYSNLYLKFLIAKVLTVNLGGDIRFFTSYQAPEYSPLIGQFTTQGNGENNVDIGNYPIINVYANMHLKHTRFYVMMSHVNAGDGGKRFFVPHYPLNGMVLRFGVSWNFFN